MDNKLVDKLKEADIFLGADPKEETSRRAQLVTEEQRIRAEHKAYLDKRGLLPVEPLALEWAEKLAEAKIQLEEILKDLRDSTDTTGVCECKPYEKAAGEDKEYVFLPEDACSYCLRCGGDRQY